MTKLPKLEIAVAEMAVSLKAVQEGVDKINIRLDVMEQNFARKDDVGRNAAAIIELRNAIQTQEINQAVLKSQFRTWGIAGGVVVTLVSAFISALQIHI